MKMIKTPENFAKLRADQLVFGNVMVKGNERKIVSKIHPMEKDVIITYLDSTTLKCGKERIVEILINTINTKTQKELWVSYKE
jgi:hypothetical protein